MKRLINLIAVLSLMVACTEPVISTFGSIGGTVQDAKTEAYLAGVKVTINPLGYSQVTNADGAFQYDNLDVAEYTLIYEKTGYDTYKHKVTVKPGLVSPVQVTLTPASSSLSYAPEVLDFGTKTNEIQMTLTNSVGGNIAYTLSASNSWISLSKTSGTVSKTDYVTVLVSRSGLSPADYNGNIVLTVDGNETIIPVRMSVAAAGVPVVTMEGASDVTSSAAVLSGTIRSLGDSKVSQHGFCWSSTNQYPTVSDECSQLGDASDVKSFSAKISGLTPATEYYVRAYAVNTYGTSYSESAIKFTTSASSQPGPGDDPQSGEIVVPQGLMSYYTFDNEDASDATENELDGTLIENPSFISETVDGTGKALYLNGIKNQYMTIPYNVLKALAKYSVSLWIKDFSQGLIFCADGGNGLPYLYVRDNQKFLLYNWAASFDCRNQCTFSYDCTPVMSSEWHHLVVTSNNDKMILYMDGARVDAISHSYSTSSASKMTIGGLYEDTASYMTMKVDNVRFYQRVLSDEEVKEIYDDEK